jgi:pSer/pThr/pTyr-binding forkhead associated (FHA) protein
MEKLVILLNKEIVNELILDKAELVLGRDSSNDFQLTDSSVSRRHVKLTRIMNDYLVEDLGSTNGTSLNGKPVQKQMLKAGDILKVGKFRLRYVSGEAPEEEAADAGQDEQQPAPAKQTPVSRKAILHFVAGPDEGRLEELRKGLFTIGTPGDGVGTVAARSQGFFLLYLGGDEHPRVNGREVESGGEPLEDGDLLEVGEHRVRISIEQGG